MFTFDILQNYLFNSSILVPLIAYVMTTYYRYAAKGIYDVWESWCRKYNTVELVGTINEDKQGVTTKISLKLKALIYYINNNCLNDDTPMKLLEIAFTSYSLYDSYDAKSPGFITDYLLDQHSPIRLTDDIECKLRISSFNDVQEQRTVKVKDIHASVYSETKSIVELKTFLRTLEMKYDEYVQSKMNSNTYCFMYIKDENGKPVFNTNVFSSTKTFDNLVFAGKTNLQNRLDFFIENKDFYNQLGIPYTLGLLLYGLPGTGKTSTLKAIANYTKRHMIIIPMTKITKLSTLRQIITSEELNDFMVPHHKRLYIFEEIDCNGMDSIIKKRDGRPNVNEPGNNLQSLLSNVVSNNMSNQQVADIMQSLDNSDKVTLGGLLELIDGINETPGRILIMTTNNDPQSFDDALLRPGRIDMKVKFANCSVDDICQLYYMWFKTDIPRDMMPGIVGDQYSPAELGEIFINNIGHPDNILEILTRQKQ